MAIYLILMLIFGVSSWLSYERPTNLSVAKSYNKVLAKPYERDKTHIIICVITMLILVSSCRAISVGYDTVNYYIHFEHKSLYNEYAPFEPLYELLNLLVIKLGLPYNILLLLCATITFVSFGVAVKRFSTHHAMVFFFLVGLGFLGNTFNAVRQYLALSMFLLSLKYIKEGNFLKYSVFVLIACLFHTSAIILFPIYFTRYFKLNIKFIIMISILLVVGAFLLEPVVKIVSQFMNFNYYERYFASGQFKEGISLYYCLYALGMLGVFVLFYLLRNTISRQNKDMSNYDLFLMLFFICVSIRIFGTLCGMFSIINRLNVYFFFSIIFLLPYLVDFVKPVFRKLILITIFILGGAYNLISGLLRETNGVYPYKFIWNNDILPTILFYIVISCLSIIIIWKSVNLRKFYQVGDQHESSCNSINSDI